VVFLAEGECLTLISDSERIPMVRYDAVVLQKEDVWTLEAARATVFIVDIFPNDE